jgi:alkylation response protein AidB-like acyl-CoA dehydrogenase
MNLSLTDEQRMFSETLRRVLDKSYSFDRRRHYERSDVGFSRDLWAQHAALGILSLPFSETQGGHWSVEMMLVMEAFGRALALEPFLATVVLCGGILRRGSDTSQTRPLLQVIGEGMLRLSLAHDEPVTGRERQRTRATKTEHGYCLDGDKSLVLSGDSADRFIVSASLESDGIDNSALALFLVDAQSAGVWASGYSTHDGGRAADLCLRQVFVPENQRIAVQGDARELVESVLDEATAAICAEAVGAMDEALAMTLQHLRQRQQFGVAIGSFQSLRHRVADMFIALEQAKSMAILANLRCCREDEGERAKAASAAKIQIGSAGRFIGQQAIQLHGAIGMSDEYKVGHLFKRLTIIDKMFGDVPYHIERLNQRGGILA